MFFTILGRVGVYSHVCTERAIFVKRAPLIKVVQLYNFYYICAVKRIVAYKDYYKDFYESLSQKEKDKGRIKNEYYEQKAAL